MFKLQHGKLVSRGIWIRYDTTTQCLIYEEECLCVLCNNRYALHDDFSCIQCKESNCEYFQVNTCECFMCKVWSGYYRMNGICVPCNDAVQGIRNCEICSVTSTEWVEYKNGFELKNKNVCDACSDQNCLVFAEKCECMECKEKYFIKSTSGICTSCESLEHYANFSQNDSICIDCEHGLVWSGGECVDCEARDDCVTYENDTCICTKCVVEREIVIIEHGEISCNLCDEDCYETYICECDW